MKNLSVVVLSVLSLMSTIIFTTRPVSAQTPFGTILGTVRDPSGAVITGAVITVTNVSTTLSYTAATDNSGNYLIPALPVGAYNVSAAHGGFKKAVVNLLKLDVDKMARVDFTLPVGEVNESIQVQEVAPLVDTDSSSPGTVVENKAIVGMPLNGRNFLQLSTLTPGVIQPSGGIGVANAKFLPGIVIGSQNSIGGARMGGNALLLDGVDFSEPNTNGAVVQPNPDEIQEFKIQTTTMNAEFGQPAVMNVITKSGTNRLHGNIYEFLRNDIFDANEYFAKRAGLHKAPLRFNQFGGTVGGPLVIPKVYNGRNRTFFFAAYDGNRIRTPGQVVANLPPPAFLKGDFSSLGTPVIDPTTGAPFQGNMIPSNRFSQFATGYIPFIPPPNLPQGQIPGANFELGVSNPSHFNSFTGRIDHSFAKSLLFGRYTYQSGGAHTLGITDLWDLLSNTGEQNLVLGYNYTFSPKVINEARFAYNRVSIKVGSTPANGDINYAGDIMGLKNLTVSQGFFTFPNVSLSGYSTMGNPFSGSTLTQNSNTFTLVDSVSFTKGKHLLKTGVNIRRVQFTLGPGQVQNGLFNFPGSFTGNSVADFILGYPQVAVAGVGANGDFMLSTLYSAFIQDDWKTTPRLTLNYGLRWDYSQPPIMSNNHQGILDPSFPGGRILIAGSPDYVIPGVGLVRGSGPPLVSRGMLNSDYHGFGPRFGFAFRPFSDDKTAIRGGYGIYVDRGIENETSLSRYSPPFFFQETLVSGPVTPELSTDNLFPVPTTFVGGGAGSRSITESSNSYVQQWSLDIQRELGRSWLLEAGYLGAKGTHLQQRVPFNQAVPGPGPIASRVPLANLNPAFIVSENVASSIYHAFIVKLEKRFAGGFSILSSYTFAKLIDTSTGTSGPLGSTPTAQNARCLACERGLSDLDVRNRFVTSYTYELPFGRNRKFASNISGALNHIIGGWDVVGITTFQSGAPVNVTTPGDRANVGAGAQRPNQTGPVSKMDFRATGFAFDTSVFALPAADTFGDARRNAAPGPGINNTDLGLHKNFYFNQEGAFLQFRAEAFNIFNTAQFLPPGNVFNTPQFGRFTGTRGPRVIQLGLKLGF